MFDAFTGKEMFFQREIGLFFGELVETDVKLKWSRSCLRMMFCFFCCVFSMAFHDCTISLGVV